MSARIPRDKDLALDDVCQRVDGAEDLRSLHSMFPILDAMAMLVHREAVLSELNEDFALFECACWVDNTEQHARLGEENPRLLFQIQFLVELHAMEDAREDRLLSDVDTFEDRFLQRGLEAFAGVHRQLQVSREILESLVFHDGEVLAEVLALIFQYIPELEMNLLDLVLQPLV